MQLYQLLKDRQAPKPGNFSGLDQAGRREYFTEAQRRKRARVKAADEAGSPLSTTANIRDALADAALMILATNGPGAEQVRHVLRTVFKGRAGVAISVEVSARQGKLHPKMLSLGSERSTNVE